MGAVRKGVLDLVMAGRHDLAISLVNALGKRTFTNDRLGDEAIEWIFRVGASKGIRNIVELYYEHLEITSESYAHGLNLSWNKGEPNQVFQFLLGQADQGDLDRVKEGYAYRDYPWFRSAIDEAFKTAPSAGSRRRRLVKRTISEVLASITKASEEDGPSTSSMTIYMRRRKGRKEGESEMQETGAKTSTD